MKCVLIVCNVAIGDEILEVLDEIGLKTYTRWENVTGVGKQSGPHLGTHIWPGRNTALAVVADDNEAEQLLNGIRRLRAALGKEGVKAFCINVEDLT